MKLLKVDNETLRTAFAIEEYEQSDMEHFYYVLLEGCQGWLNFDLDEVVERMEDNYELSLNREMICETDGDWLYFESIYTQDEDFDEKSQAQVEDAFTSIKNLLNLVMRETEYSQLIMVVEK